MRGGQGGLVKDHTFSTFFLDPSLTNKDGKACSLPRRHRPPGTHSWCQSNLRLFCTSFLRPSTIKMINRGQDIGINYVKHTLNFYIHSSDTAILKIQGSFFGIKVVCKYATKFLHILSFQKMYKTWVKSKRKCTLKIHLTQKTGFFEQICWTHFSNT